jgi:hypothetical protein
MPVLIACHQLMSSDRARIVISRNGESNVEVAGAPYHSSYNPSREAQKFYGPYDIEKADVIFHFGWGLGYAGDALRRRLKPSGQVIIFEPDEEVFSLWRTHADNAILRDPRFKFVVGGRVWQFFDEWTMDGYRETDHFLWLVWPAARQLHGGAATSLQQKFTTRLRDRAANLLTHFQNGRMYFDQALTNFGYQVEPGAGLLFGRFRNVPLVIVSAGPSLDRNVRELRGMEDHCFILAVDTALRPLLAAGVVPHAVIIADPTELNARHVAEVMPESTYLIAEQAVHSLALRSAKRRFLFGLGLFPDPLFAKFGFAKSVLQVWGSVATAALDLAWRMEANPIIFAGQDFGYSWDRDYARHTMFDGREFNVAAGGAHRAEDIWGRNIWTTENLIAYRDFVIRRIKSISNVRFINATEGGILKEGVEILSLRDALYQSCKRKIDIAAILGGCYRPGPIKIAAIEHLCSVLKTATRDCGCLDGFLELTAKQALLKGDDEGVSQTLLWGLAACERLCRTGPGDGTAVNAASISCT